MTNVLIVRKIIYPHLHYFSVILLLILIHSSLPLTFILRSFILLCHPFIGHFIVRAS